MALRNNALAAVNGSYFALNGETIGTLKMDGEIAGIPELPRTAFGVLPDGNIILSQVDYHGTVTLPNGQAAEIGGVDCERGPDGLILYNHYYGDRTGTNEYGIEYVVINNKVTAINTANSVIPADGVVLSAHGAAKDALASLKVGDTVSIRQTLGADLDKARDVLGAGPLLVKNGSVFVTAKTEEFPSDISVGRAPRTALGVTKSGHILLVVVDGRQPDHSIGMTLTELAGFMKELGAVQAMNFDGGGSSEMTVGDNVVNLPSDGHERPVGTAIAVEQK
jgi:exopolysaccharide biosynthesis protein